MADESCNGWKNWETWNIAVWLNNDESYYKMVREFARKKPKSLEKTYDDFLDYFSLRGTKTPDGVPFDSNKIDGKAIMEDIIYDE